VDWTDVDQGMVRWQTEVNTVTSHQLTQRQNISWLAKIPLASQEGLCFEYNNSPLSGTYGEWGVLGTSQKLLQKPNTKSKQ
jgi:hypothetical protein